MRLRRLGRRRSMANVAALAVVALLINPHIAAAATADEVRFLTMTNGVRASVGAGPLMLDEGLSITARRWAATVASAGRITHNPDLPITTSGPTAIAENVAVGTSIQLVQDSLVASRPHYVNLVNPSVTKVGIGVAWAGGLVYVVENFLIVRGATLPTSPPTTIRSSPTTSSPITIVPGRMPSTVPTPTTLAPARPAGPGPSSPATAGEALPSAWMQLSFEVLRGWDRPLPGDGREGPSLGAEARIA